ncbi:hypothetical protein [Streptococcus pluranimalium]|uniref:hypothetical protein n=1 Tax=Streptococcus pluranimalium TaxID=82348 RepID=UPI0039FCC03C
MNIVASLIEFIGNLFASGLWSAIVTMFVIVILLILEKYINLGLLKYQKIFLGIVAVIFLTLWVVAYTIILPNL